MALISIYGTLYNVTGEAIVKVEQAYDSVLSDSELGELLSLQADASVDQHTINEAIATAVNQGGGGGGVSIEVVQELPQTGESNVIYLVPKETMTAGNIFDEYIYTNNAWELIGSTDIDLSNYVQTNDERLIPTATMNLSYDFNSDAGVSERITNVVCTFPNGQVPTNAFARVTINCECDMYAQSSLAYEISTTTQGFLNNQTLSYEVGGQTQSVSITYVVAPIFYGEANMQSEMLIVEDGGNIICQILAPDYWAKNKMTELSDKLAEVAFTGSYDDLTDAPDPDDYIEKTGLKTINNQSLIGEGNITIEGGGTDADVTLSADLYTRYPVGKFTQAAANNPVKVGELGDSLRDVWNNIFQMEDEEATITNPTISLAVTSSASDERGTSFGTLDYAITTTTGEYSFNNPTTATGVTWSKYSITSNDATDIEDTTSTTGTITLNSNYVVGTSSSLTFSVSGTHGNGNYALTKFGEVSETTRIVAATVNGSDVTFSKTAVDYPYSTTSASDTAPTTATKKSTSLLTTAGLTLDYTANQYLYVYKRKASGESAQPTKTIEIYSDLTKEWSPFLGGTINKGSVTLTKANGTTDEFWAYMTQTTAASTDSAKMRLV